VSIDSLHTPDTPGLIGRLLRCFRVFPSDTLTRANEESAHFEHTPIPEAWRGVLLLPTIGCLVQRTSENTELFPRIIRVAGTDLGCPVNTVAFPKG